MGTLVCEVRDETMRKPILKKDKYSDGWYIDWYGIKVFIYPSSVEPITNEYNSPSVQVSKVHKYSDETAVEFFIEGDE